ncbi:MAG: hypothetical protein EOO09_21700, partial [Chitinophagaceae bacterium]
MSQQIQTSGVLIPVIMVWIVTFAVGRPLGEGGKLPRAQGSEGLASATPAVSAHLWEDPLEVVGGLVRHPTKSEKEEKISKPSDFQQTPAEQAGEKLAIFVPLRGALSTDHAEYRRRQRYAVQAALWCRGYRPDKPRKLASISLDFKRLSGDDVESAKNWCNIPYEDFRYDKDDRLPVRVRIYYLNTELVPDFVRGAAVIAGDAKLLGWRLTMTSPPSSDALSSILKPRKELPSSFDALKDSILIRNLFPSGSISIYNTQAAGYFEEFQTSSSHVMHRRMEGFPWLTMKVTVNQLIESDDKAKESILEELKNRGVSLGEDAGLSGQPTRMALFAEWETTFGREFYKQFKGDKIGTNVLGYFYLKGLDGQPPTDRRRKSGSDTLIPGLDTKEIDSAGDALIRLIEPPSLPIPVGPYQFDYLARLGQKLVDEDRDRRSDAGGAIRAIGLLSTDLEDKLALLKILRPRFPEAVYFTNVLEADFLQSENTKYARNLLVFTRYDLEGKNILTGQKLECELPVFRTAHQVALVDAIWASLENRSAPKPNEKRGIKLYEIGLRKAHPLEPVTPHPRRAWAELKPFRHLVFPLLILALILKANWLGRRVSPPETPTPLSHGPKGINAVWWSVISVPVVWAISMDGGWKAIVAGVATGLFVEAQLADNESFFQKYLRPKGFRWINAVWWSVISVPVVWAISVDGGWKAIVVGIVTGLFCYWVRCLPEPSVDWLRGFVFGPKKGLDLELKEALEKSSVDAPTYESSVDAPPKPPPGRAVTAKGSPEGGRGTGAWWTGSILLALWGLAWWANAGPWSILMLLVSSGLALCLLCYRVSPEKISWKTLFGAVVLIFLGAAVVRWIMWEKIREPMVLADGVSVWPAVILRFVCALVALLSLRPIWKGLQLLQNECTGRFFFRSRMHACEKNGEQRCFLTRLFPVIDPRNFSGSNAWQFQNQEKIPTEAARWRDYLIFSNPFEDSSKTPSFSRRWIVLSISGVLLTVVVMALFG